MYQFPVSLTELSKNAVLSDDEWQRCCWGFVSVEKVTWVPLSFWFEVFERVNGVTSKQNAWVI